MEAVHPLCKAKVRIFREVIDGGGKGLRSYRAVIEIRRGASIAFDANTFEGARQKAEAWRADRIRAAEAKRARKRKENPA